MSLKTRDAEGYPLQGIDVVPERVSENRKEVETKQTLANLVQLLQQANERERKSKEAQERRFRKYRSLEQEYLALKYGNLCDECIRVKDDVEDVTILCKACSNPAETIKSLQLKLEKVQEESRYWQDCFEIALEYDGRGDDGSGQRV